MAASRSETLSRSDGGATAEVGFSKVFEGRNAGFVSLVSETNEHASLDVNVGMDERRQAIERSWIAELVAVGGIYSKIAEEGLEQINDLSGTSNIFVEGSAKSSALCAETHSLAPQLQLLIERWPTLSNAVQQQIMLLVG